MTPFLLVNQKSFHVDEPPDELVRVPKNEKSVENQQYLQGLLEQI